MKLCCPKCKTVLSKNNRVFSCINNHSYDLSKQGYLNLYLSNNTKIHGDNKEMVNARTTFLEKDYYLPLKDALNEKILSLKPTTLLDLACGEGYYTKDFPCTNKIGLDLSKDAILYASKKDKNTQYCIASIFDCPIDDDSTDCITTIFAPISENEIQRCLKDNGHFLCVFPAENHLFELKAKIYDTPYQNSKPTPCSTLKLVEETRITKTIHCSSKEDINALFMMTPYYFKTSFQDKEKINNIDHLDITIDFYIMHYTKNKN